MLCTQLSASHCLQQREEKICIREKAVSHKEQPWVVAHATECLLSLSLTERTSIPAGEGESEDSRATLMVGGGGFHSLLLLHCV